MDADDLYEQLMAVDPERASQLHPNNIRKISRSLQIFHSTGKTHTALMNEQKEKTGSSNLSKNENSTLSFSVMNFEILCFFGRKYFCYSSLVST